MLLGYHQNIEQLGFRTFTYELLDEFSFFSSVPFWCIPFDENLNM